ncbi:CHAT domain-containing protein [Saccharothrix deserti]|uniref:CHAT domain-containing protein n=1 Tax=Saccharothrix deserti TaxID=2593674 RepID=UPI00131E16B2|nr:CHAT domain-containing protein [Saccharothrix deserti]
MRDELSAELLARLQDPGVDVLDAGVLELARRLERATADVDHDPEVLLLLLTVHWQRYRLLPVGQDLHDMSRLLDLTGRLAALDEQLVPPVLRDLVGNPTAAHEANVLDALQNSGADEEAFARLIDTQRHVVDDLPVGSPDRGRAMLLLVELLRNAAERFGDADRARDAVAVARSAALEPWDAESLPFMVMTLMTALLGQYQHTGELPVLDEAIEAARQGVAVSAAEDVWAHQANLGHALSLAFRATSDTSLLDESIALLRHAWAARPKENPLAAIVPMYLAMALQLRFDATDDMSVLDEITRMIREATVGLDPGSPFAGAIWGSLCTVTRLRFERVDDARFLTESVEAGRVAVRLVPPGHNDRAEVLSALGVALLRRYELDRDSAAGDEACALLREACSTSRADHPKRVAWLTNLATALRALYDRTREPAVVDEALDAARTAARLPVASGPEKPGILQALAAVLLNLHRQLGDQPALDEAVRLLREAVRLVDGDARAPLYLGTLASALGTAHTVSGDRRFLLEAIETAYRAVVANPLGHVDRPAHLSRMGAILTSGYHLTGDLSLLRRAVAVGRQAVAESAETRLEWPVLVSRLSSALRDLADRTPETGLLDEAVAMARSAVAALPPNDPVRPAHLGSLAATLEELYDRTGDPQADRESVALLRTAVAEADRLSPDTRASLRSSLSARLLGNGTRAADRAVLVEAEELAAEAVSLTADRPVSHAFAVYRLARVRLARYRNSPDSTVIASASRLFHQVADTVGVPVGLTLRALRWSASTALVVGDTERAVADVERAVALLPELAPETLDTTDRRRLIVSTEGLASTALAALARAGRPERAVELLEQTRGILVADAITGRTGLDALREVRADLADEVARLRIARAGLNRPDDDDPLAAVRRRDSWTAAWKGVLDRIHALTDFSHFLMPPEYDDLRAESAEGPIVYVAAEERGGVAVVVTPEGPVVVELPDADANGAARQVRKLREAHALADGPTSGEWHEAQVVVGQVLERCWSAIAEPVLDRLVNVDRLWWCPVGVLGALPLHAAGRHTARDGSTVFDRVVSSYTPSVRALAWSRAAAAAATPSLLVVAAPDVEGGALPSVGEEVRHLVGAVPSATVLSGGTTRDDVLSELPRHTAVHFACHGVADVERPEESMLVLHDHLISPLTVSAIARLRLERADLAYLSACSTAETARGHHDESTHVAGALQLAGFREVVGTLWPIRDRFAARVAAKIYDRIVVDGVVRTAPGAAARAVHEVIRNQRDRKPDRPLDWAAHVHFGR